MKVFRLLLSSRTPSLAVNINHGRSLLFRFLGQIFIRVSGRLGWISRAQYHPPEKHMNYAGECPVSTTEGQPPDVKP